jgi:hypothetical protein
MENDKSAARELDEARREDADPARREVLTTIGRFIYAAPALALLAEPKGAQAGYGRGGGKPGWGFGDKNHHHSGPPAKSVKTGVWRSVETGKLENGR